MNTRLRALLLLVGVLVAILLASMALNRLDVGTQNVPTTVEINRDELYVPAESKLEGLKPLKIKRTPGKKDELVKAPSITD